MELACRQAVAYWREFFGCTRCNPNRRRTLVNGDFEPDWINEPNEPTNDEGEH